MIIRLTLGTLFGILTAIGLIAGIKEAFNIEELPWYFTAATSSLTTQLGCISFGVTRSYDG